MVPSKTHQLSLFPYRVGGGASEIQSEAPPLFRAYSWGVV